MILGQCVTLYSFQVFYNELFNDNLPLNCGDGSTRKTITVRLTDVIVYEFEHVMLTCIMVRGGRRHQRAGPPDVLFQNTTTLIKLLCLQDLSPRWNCCMLWISVIFWPEYFVSCCSVSLQFYSMLMFEVMYLSGSYQEESC